jgi:hypothetical protein
MNADPRRLGRLFLAGLLSIAAIAVLCPRRCAALEAGVARADLTPPLELKASLGGYGLRQSRPATGVRDRVWVKALVLREGKDRRALVTADLLAFPPGFREALAAALGDGWQADQLLLLASHTHTSLDLTALRLGDLTFAGVPGEMAAGLGLEAKAVLRERIRAKHVAIGGLADEWISYMLTPEEYRRGGYEASVSFYGETLGPQVVRAAIAAATAVR